MKNEYCQRCDRAIKPGSGGCTNEEQALCEECYLKYLKTVAPPIPTKIVNKTSKKARDKNIGTLIALAIIVGLVVWGYRSFTQTPEQITQKDSQIETPEQLLQTKKQAVLENTLQIGQKGILKNDTGMDGCIIQKDSEILVLDIDKYLVRSKIRVLSGLRLGIEGWVPCEFVVKMPEGINEKSSKYVTEAGKEGVLGKSYVVSTSRGDVIGGGPATAELFKSEYWGVEGGTRVLVIERYYNRTKVKILEGQYQGSEGWVEACIVVNR